MNVQIIKAYAVHGDGGERGTGPVEGYCETHADAQIMCRGRAWYGGDGAIAAASVLVVDGVMYALASPAPLVFMNAAPTQQDLDAAARESALAKLNPADRRALGIK